jgi:hypothetical protein
MILNLTYISTMKLSKKKKSGKTGIYTTNLRLPEKVAEIVKKAAEDSNRSFNSEVLTTLEEKYL